MNDEVLMKTAKTSLCLLNLLKDAVFTPVTFAIAPDQHHITTNLPRSEQMMEYIRQQGKTYTIAELKNTRWDFLCYRHTIQYRGEARRGLNASLRKKDVLKTRRDVSCQCWLFRKACRTSSKKVKNNTSRSNVCIIVTLLNEDKWQRFTLFIVGK